MSKERKGELVVLDEAREYKMKLEDAAAEAEAADKPDEGAQPKRGHFTVPPAAQRQAQKEFREWKRELMDMVRREATISWTLTKQGLVYQFVLPPRLVKLVWSTTLKERIKLERMKGPDGAERRAVESIRSEVDGAVAAVQDLEKAYGATAGRVADGAAAQDADGAEPKQGDGDGRGDPQEAGAGQAACDSGAPEEAN